jgi:hypothetical protein
MQIASDEAEAAKSLLTRLLKIAADEAAAKAAADEAVASRLLTRLLLNLAADEGCC